MIAEAKRTQIIKPANLQKLGFVPQNTIDDINAASAKIRSAQQIWQQKSFRERGTHLKKMRRFLASHGQEFAEQISRDNGKTVQDAYLTEILPGILALDYYIKHTERVLKPRSIKGSHIFSSYKSNLLQHVPFGVVGIISPWNYPFAIPFSEIIMALAAGNGVLFKGASETIMVNQVLLRVVRSGDLPHDLFIPVHMDGKTAGKAFLQSGIDKLFFTGSVGVGKILMGLASETLTPVSLELGGNDAMIVFDDAQVKRAVNGAIWAGFQNAGQSCGGVERIYVHESILDDFLNQLKTKLESLKVADSEREWADIGSLTTAKQVETVKNHIKEAISKGARIHAKGRINGEAGYFLEPTVLTNVTNDMLIMQEESFGPVVTVCSFSDEKSVIKEANDSIYGLTASVWTRNRRRGKRVATQLEAGVITDRKSVV